MEKSIKPPLINEILNLKFRIVKKPEIKTINDKLKELKEIKINSNK